MITYSVDFESYYDDTVSISTMGTVRYVETTDIYMVSIVGDDGFEWVGHPKDAPWRVIDGSILVSHNRSFDGYIMCHLRDVGVIPREYEEAASYCSANAAAYHQYPRDLKTACKLVLGKEVSKDVRKAMNCKRWEDMSPEFQAEVTEYALQDSRLCLELWKKLSPTWPEHERRIANLNDEAGWRGIPVDEAYVDECITKLELQLFEYRQQIPWSGDEEKKLLSMKNLGTWCRETGIPCPTSLAKDNEEFNEWAAEYGEKYPVCKAMSNYRRVNVLLEKFKTLKAGTVRGRYRYSMKYFGAHTGRFSGSGGANLQNLSREEMFGVNMRAVFKPGDGKKFITCDLSQIEPRVLAVFCGDTKLLDYVRTGADLYEAHARTYMGYTDPRPLKDVDKKMRQYSKARTLGLGYSCGADKFVTVAKVLAGLDITLDEAQAVVTDFRAKSHKTVGFWKTLDNALRRAHGDSLNVTLPSGRVSRYRNVRVGADRNVTATMTRSDRLATVKLYGGLIAENLTQACARDILAEQMLAAHDAGLDYLWSVHDEIIIETTDEKAEADMAKLVEIMTTPPKWWPNIPLAAEAAIVDRYTK